MKSSYKVGNIIKCYVTGIEKYGIFVSIDNAYDGLIHISEVSEDFVKNIHDYVKVGENIYCQILEINDENMHFKLSIKNINYKEDDDSPIKETRKGFLPLKEKYEVWLNEKLEIYKN